MDRLKADDERFRIGTRVLWVVLDAFRLVGASKQWPDAVSAAGTSGFAFHYANTAACKPNTLAAVGR
jgi:hypothetical protein